MNTMLRNSLPWAAILLVCLFGYGNILQHDFNLDDAYILNYLPLPDQSVWNVFSQPFGAADYRPISLLSFAMEQRLFGSIDPQTAHGVNLSLFIALCFLIYATLRALPIEQAPLIALCTTLLFAAHPVHSGVVSSIKGRDTILSLLLAVSAIGCVIRAENRHKPEYYALAFLFFVAGLYTKLDSMVLVFIIPLLLHFFFRAPWKKTAIFYFTLLAGILLLRYLPVNLFILDNQVLKESVSFVENPLSSQPGFLNGLAQALQTLFIYLKFMVIPSGYYFYFGYDMLPLLPFFSLPTLLYLGLHGLIVAFAFQQYKRQPVISFAILSFYFCLSYCSNLVTPVAGIVADRYAFFASLAFCLFAAAGLYALAKKRTGPSPEKQPSSGKQKPGKTALPDNRAKRLTYSATAFLTLICTGFTYNRNQDWQHILTLLDADLPKLERSFEANRIGASNYLKIAAETTDPASKKAYTEKGLQCALKAKALFANNAFILESIGQAYFNLGQPQLAIPVLQESVLRFDTLPTSAEVLGDLYYISGNHFDSSAYYYRVALNRHTPHEVVSLKYLRALIRNGQLPEAVKYSDSLLQYRAEQYQSWQCKAFVLLQQQDSLEGLRLYTRSFELGYRNPEDARNVQQKLFRMNDTVTARKLDTYLNP